jgi:hypothetical protein
MSYNAELQRLYCILMAELEGRPIDSDEVRRLVEHLREKCPDIAVTLTLIARRIASFAVAEAA